MLKGVLKDFLQVPDFLNARINGSPVKEVIKDHKWLEEEFTEKVQKVRLVKHPEIYRTNKHDYWNVP